MLIQQYLQQAEQLLPSSESARIDMEVLLCDVLNKSRSWLFTWGDRALSDVQLGQLQGMLARRNTGEPIAYIIGYREFWNSRFLVSSATLIPRPETEHIIEWVLENITQLSVRCLDMGTGTGAIALSLALEKPQWQCVATDFSSDAVNLAKKNAQELSVTNTQFFVGSWFDALPNKDMFDVIVSNPPYVENSSPFLSQGDVRFEPNSALTSGDDGLDDIRAITASVLDYLSASGVLLLEHGYQQGTAVRELLEKAGLQRVTTLTDLSGLDRITLGFAADVK